MSDYKDIWSPEESSGAPLSEEQLLAYLEGQLPEEERRAVELLLANEGMESDAIDGLQSMSVEDSKALKLRLNAGLQQALHKKRRTRRGIGDQRWSLIAILIVLLLAAVCYAVVYLVRQPAH